MNRKNTSWIWEQNFMRSRQKLKGEGRGREGRGRREEVRKIDHFRRSNEQVYRGQKLTKSACFQRWIL
jgi:hypothetical protein